MPEKILDAYITVACLGSGFAAVHRVLVKEDECDPYWDIQQTGIGRYASSDEAIVEAKSWAEAEGLRLDAGL